MHYARLVTRGFGVWELVHFTLAYELAYSPLSQKTMPCHTCYKAMQLLESDKSK
jgi:hypothetical protein